jgi:hypothetical protein
VSSTGGRRPPTVQGVPLPSTRFRTTIRRQRRELTVKYVLEAVVVGPRADAPGPGGHARVEFPPDDEQIEVPAGVEYVPIERLTIPASYVGELIIASTEPRQRHSCEHSSTRRVPS